MKTKQNKYLVNNASDYVGCDIVSLTDGGNIKSFNNERYIKKILTDKEFEYYTQSEKKFQIPPLFWSCKESAYKIMLQKGLKSSFSPKLFNVELNGTETLSENSDFRTESLTYFENQTFFCHSIVEKEFVFTFATTSKQELKNVITHIEKKENFTIENQSISTYNLLLNSISQHFEKDKLHLKITKNMNGNPLIYCDDKILKVPFSVSHDENFVSFAFLKK